MNSRFRGNDDTVLRAAWRERPAREPDGFRIADLHPRRPFAEEPEFLTIHNRYPAATATDDPASLEPTHDADRRLDSCAGHIGEFLPCERQGRTKLGEEHKQSVSKTLLYSLHCQIPQASLGLSQAPAEDADDPQRHLGPVCQKGQECFSFNTDHRCFGDRLG